MGGRVASKVMKGAIAAGHPLTAQAGARVLEAGGSAVDACVAAAFVSWVCESPLTGPGGGGFMLVHEAETGRTVVLDFFVAVPARALGLEAAHRLWGRMPWAELVAPAAALAREGFELTPMQGYLHEILDGLLRHSPEGNAMSSVDGRAYRA